ncbi:MAG: flagellar basal body rod protein FlgB [Phycisphaerales bacterium]
MLTTELATADSIPALEAAMQFAARRQALIAHNIANLDTPNFQQRDVSPRSFQDQLGAALEARRGETGGMYGALRLTESDEVRQGADGLLRLDPRSPSMNVLFHDRNNRDLETLMKDQAENLLAFRFATEMLRTRFGVLRSAISERP